MRIKKEVVPKFLFEEEERYFLEKTYRPKNIMVNIGNRKVSCYEFNISIDEIMNDKADLNLLESTSSDAEKRAFATRAATIAFQSIRDLSNINGLNLIEIGKGLKAVSRVTALAACVAIANIDMMFARRLLPLVRAI